MRERERESESVRERPVEGLDEQGLVVMQLPPRAVEGECVWECVREIDRASMCV